MRVHTEPEAPNTRIGVPKIGRRDFGVPGRAQSVAHADGVAAATGVPNARSRRAHRLRALVERYDSRSAAVVLSTSGAMPLPLLAVVSPDIIRPGLMPLLAVIWAFTFVVLATTTVVGKLSDRLFVVFGFFGMVGIAGSSYLVTEPAAAGVIITLLAAIPAIAAMSSPRRVVVTFTVVAVVFAVALAFVDATSVAGIVVKCGASIANVMVPVFIVAALRGSLELTMRRYALLGDTDPLTGLLNRRGFLTRSGKLLARVSTSGDQIGFMLIDVDHFKSVNDRLGHAVGDSVLVDTVVAINRAAPPDALVGRFGGEEFVVLCPTGGQSELAVCAERIRDAVSSMSSVTVSIGAVTAPLSSTRSGQPNISHVIDHLTHLADRWVYVAKSAGRDRVVCLSSSPIHFVDDRRSAVAGPDRW